MMENIQTYSGSDSESEPECDPTSHLTMQDSSVDNDNSERKLNFFGLESASMSSRSFSQEVTRSNKKEENKRTNHANDDTTMSVPDGDFWHGFIPDPNDTEIHDLYAKYFKFENTPKEVTQNNVSEIRLKKRPVTNEHSFQTVTNEKRICLSSSRLTHKGSLNQHSEVSSLQQETRKIFYVHSKVTPYLAATNHACKCVSRQSSSWRAHAQAINRILWNKSNFSHLLLTAGMDSLIKVWNVWSCLDRCVSTISHHSKAVRNALWGIHGRSIISCSYDKTAIVTDVESGAIQSRHVHPGFVVACCLHPNNPNCFVTGSENLIQFWDQRTPLAPTKTLTYKGDMGQPQDLLFIQNGTVLISCSDIVSRDSSDRTIMSWDVGSGNVISNQIYQEKYTCTRLRRHPSDAKFLAQTQGGYVALFSTTRPYKMDKHKRFEGHKMQGYNIGFDVSGDGILVYSGSAEGGIHCYDYRSGCLIKKCVKDNRDVITDVACHPVLSSLVAASTWGGSLALWQ